MLIGRMRRSRVSSRSHPLRHGGTRLNLPGRQIAQVEQQIVHAVHRSRAILFVQLLELRLDVGKSVGIQQLAQLRFSSSSRNCPWSMDSACARRSASGASPS